MGGKWNYSFTNALTAVKQQWRLIVNLEEEGFVFLVYIAKKANCIPFLFRKYRYFFDNNSN